MSDHQPYVWYGPSTGHARLGCRIGDGAQGCDLGIDLGASPTVEEIATASVKHLAAVGEHVDPDTNLCPRCPACGGLPVIQFYQQAFCGTDACEIWVWNPAKSAVDNLANQGEVTITGESHGIVTTELSHKTAGE
jgi:hypothetical protein